MSPQFMFTVFWTCSNAFVEPTFVLLVDLFLPIFLHSIWEML